MKNNNENKSNDRSNGKKKILIIGGVAAGTSAASKARRIDLKANIKIILILWFPMEHVVFRTS
jgi:hypothetical protein